MMSQLTTLWGLREEFPSSLLTVGIFTGLFAVTFYGWRNKRLHKPLKQKTELSQFPRRCLRKGITASLLLWIAPWCNYCVSIQGITKWVEIAFGIAIIGLICWEGIAHSNPDHVVLLDGEEFSAIGTCVVLAVTVFIYFLIVFNCHRSSSKCLHLFQILARAFYVVAMLTYIGAGAMETYASLQFQERHRTRLFGRRAAAAGLCFLNALLYMLSYIQARIMKDP